MLITVSGIEFDLDTRLRVCYEMQKKFGKPYTQLFNILGEMPFEDQVKLLYCGVPKEQQADYKQSDFLNLILDDNDLGLVGFMDILMKYINCIQYPNLSEEEIEKKILERKAKAERLQ